MRRYKIDDYQQYKENQMLRAERKWGSVTFDRDLFEAEMVNLVEEPSIVGCMGIRNGNEYMAFKEIFPLARVYGVDIHPNVREVGEDCFAYDFNDLPRRWASKFDLLYSNSIDHAFDVKWTIREWVRVVKLGGYLFLVFSISGVGKADIYSFEKADIKDLFSEVEVVKVWDINKRLFSGLFRK